MNNNKFPLKKFLKAVIAVALPVAGQTVLSITGSMIDTIMLAPTGELTVGAVGLCAQFSSLLLSCYWGFVGGGALFISQYRGARDESGIKKAYGLMLTCMTVIGMIFTILALCFPDMIINLYTDKASIHEIGVNYLRIVSVTYLLQVVAMAMSTLLRTIEQVRITFISSVCSVIVNVFVNWLLIEGHFGLPAMGVKGAAIATVVSNIANILIITVFCLIKKQPYIFEFKYMFRWGGAFVKKFFKKCFPIVLHELLAGAGIMVMNIIYGRQIEEAISAIAVFRTLEGFVIGFFFGFSSAASIVIGKAVGAGEHEYAYRGAKRLLLFCIGSIAVVDVILIALHEPILTAMSLSGKSFEIAFMMLVIYCSISLIRMSFWTTNDIFRAGGDPSFGAILEMSFMYAMVLPAMLIAAFVFHADILVIFALSYVDEPIRILIMLIRLKSGKWIKPVTKEGAEKLSEFRQKLGINKKEKCGE